MRYLTLLVLFAAFGSVAPPPATAAAPLLQNVVKPTKDAPPPKPRPRGVSYNILYPLKFKVGQEGRFAAGFEVVQILKGDDEMIVRTAIEERGFTRYGTPFLVKGVATKNMADNARITLSGDFKVTGTRKLGTQTLFVVEPAKK